MNWFNKLFKVSKIQKAQPEYVESIEYIARLRESMEKYKIQEFGDNSFQVWLNNSVVYPKNLTFEAAYQADHKFMFVDSLNEAIKLVEQMARKNTVKKVHIHNQDYL